MPPRPFKRAARAVTVSLLWAAVFFATGYYAALLSRNPRASVVALAVVSIPLGVTSKGAVHGLVRGLCCGLAGGAGVVWALMAGRVEMLDRLGVAWTGVAIAYLATGATGGLTGVCLHLTGGAGLVWAIMVGRLVPPAMLDQLTVTWAAAVTFLTTTITVAFAHLAARRRQRLKGYWPG